MSLLDHMGGHPMPMDNRHMDGWMGGWGIAMMLASAVFWLAVLTAIVLGIVALVRYLQRGGSPQTGPRVPRGALDALELRYARGEIDREDYLQRRADIERVS